MHISAPTRDPAQHAHPTRHLRPSFPTSEDYLQPTSARPVVPKVPIYPLYQSGPITFVAARNRRIYPLVLHMVLQAVHGTFSLSVINDDPDTSHRGMVELTMRSWRDGILRTWWVANGYV